MKVDELVSRLQRIGFRVQVRDSDTLVIEFGVHDRFIGSVDEIERVLIEWELRAKARSKGKQGRAGSPKKLTLHAASRKLLRHVWHNSGSRGVDIVKSAKIRSRSAESRKATTTAPKSPAQGGLPGLGRRE